MFDAPPVHHLSHQLHHHFLRQGQQLATGTSAAWRAWSGWFSWARAQQYRCQAGELCKEEKEYNQIIIRHSSFITMKNHEEPSSFRSFAGFCCQRLVCVPGGIASEDTVPEESLESVLFFPHQITQARTAKHVQTSS